MKYQDQYNNPPPADAGALSSFPEPGAKQEFCEECDINRIMARYDGTGLAPPPQVGAAFGDFSSVGDYLEVQTRHLAAMEAFAALSSKVRDRFHNNPAELIAFVQDDANATEARELGLLKTVEIPVDQVLVETLKTIATNTTPKAPEAK